MNESTIVVLGGLLRQNKRSQRSTVALHGFETGSSSGWFFEIHKVFRGSLDLRPDGKGGYTQGSAFAFSEGEILYSSAKGYAHGETADMCLQVGEARAAIPAADEFSARDRGFVSFKVYTYQTGFEERLTKRTTQDEFVAFLIAGPSMPGWADVAAVAQDIGMSW